MFVYYNIELLFFKIYSEKMFHQYFKNLNVQSFRKLFKYTCNFNVVFACLYVYVY